MGQLQEDYTHIIKGKRTKRPRSLQEKHDLATEFLTENNGKSVANFLALTMASSSSSMADSGSSGGGVEKLGGSDRTSSGEVTDGTEDEDMANCLILLAQGQTQKPLVETKAKLYVYQCNTCSRSFPSFQALGGHRASHKKPKPTGEEKKPILEDDQFSSHETTALSLQFPYHQVPVSPCKSVKTRVHDCSICGAEFSSGQALGGHMRRHRTLPASAAAGGEPQEVVVKKPRNILALDLNLPAPEVDHRETKFPFASTEQVIVFSASSLVDCHY
ncbi:zinc finger protein ZAT5-like [Diospyros lotus]|uniref:zinc finger protein ZAT5-like n=1 Tax=Diospyros lotus TaxID=55363 RepID=UPI00225BA080|nr:zinc finger protein ZAT5-like [Diospyros lotus]